jgi:hypothetical protein
MARHSDSGSGGPRFADPIDAAHYAALIDRIDALMGCTEDFASGGGTRSPFRPGRGARSGRRLDPVMRGWQRSKVPGTGRFHLEGQAQPIKDRFQMLRM